MTVNDYKEEIMMTLGAPVVDIEIEDYIPQIINKAFRELKHYITDTFSVTLPVNNRIDLSDKKVDTVINVWRSNTPNRIVNFSDIIFLMAKGSNMATPSMGDYARAMLLQQVKNTISTDLDFVYDKPERMLYVNINYPKPAAITINYIPEFENVEELTETYWQNLLLRLATACLLYTSRCV